MRPNPLPPVGRSGKNDPAQLKLTHTQNTICPRARNKPRAVDTCLFLVTSSFFPNQLVPPAIQNGYSRHLPRAKRLLRAGLCGSFWRANPGQFSRLPKRAGDLEFRRRDYAAAVSSAGPAAGRAHGGPRSSSARALVIGAAPGGRQRAVAGRSPSSSRFATAASRQHPKERVAYLPVVPPLREMAGATFTQGEGSAR